MYTIYQIVRDLEKMYSDCLFTLHKYSMTGVNIKVHDLFFIINHLVRPQGSCMQNVKFLASQEVLQSCIVSVLNPN